jgi:O-antigen/teichoic acid export membrane protein
MPIVRARLGTEDVANYGVALTCAGIVNSAISLVTGALAPRLAQLWVTRDVERYTALCRAATDIIAVLSATAIGFTALFSEEIVHIVFGKQYHTAVGATAILALGAFGLTSSAAAALAQYQSNGTFARNANVMGAIILLTLSLILVWPLGLIGVAASRALAQLVVAGLAFFSAARSTSGPLAFSPLTLLSTAAVLTLLVIIILFGAHLEVRLTIFCAFIACVIWRSGALASRAKELMKIISPTST